MAGCELCGCEVIDDTCPSCELYNAAVAAQKAAAMSIAKSAHPGAEGAWLNEYGVFARVGNSCSMVAGPEVAAPFVTLTVAARAVRFERRPAMHAGRP